MSKFTEILTVSPLPNGHTWIVKGRFGYDIGKEHSHHTITVPEGFETDFTSVPRFLWWLFPTWGKYGNAAVIHDYLYWEQDHFTRKQADKIFLEGMKILKVNFVVRRILYVFVRWFGWAAWAKNKLLKKMGRKKVVHKKHIHAYNYKKEVKKAEK